MRGEQEFSARTSSANFGKFPGASQWHWPALRYFKLLLQVLTITKKSGLSNNLPDPLALLAELFNKRLVEQYGGEAVRDKGMLTPENAVLLTVMQRQRRRIELETLRNEADTRYRADELQAQLDELDVDYDYVLQAAVLM